MLTAISTSQLYNSTQPFKVGKPRPKTAGVWQERRGVSSVRVIPSLLCLIHLELAAI